MSISKSIRDTLWRSGLIVAAGAATALGGCAGGLGGSSTGALLSVDYFGGTDVVGFHYIVENVSCAGEPIVPMTWEFNVDLADNIFPGMVEHIETRLDEQSKHLGADLFVTIDAGCWQVTAIPASELDVGSGTWSPSADCSTVVSDTIEVVDGETTEAPLLISQCVGDPVGAFDQTVVLNHPPIISVTIDEKYNYECETVEACVTAFDEDDDPIEILFSQVDGPAPFSLVQGTPEVIGYEEGHRIWKQCADITTRWTTDYDFQVTVWDLAVSGGGLVRMEDVTGEPSHDDLIFPVYTNWIEEPLCFDGNGDLVTAPDVDINRAPGCSYTSAEQYYCSGAYPVDPAILPYLCDGTTLIPEALYPNCDGSNNDHTHDPTDPEVPCNGIDDDGDGDIDENSVTTTEYTWTHTGGGGNASAGAFTALEMTYSPDTETLSFAGTLTYPDPWWQTNFFEFALNNGPNPNGQGELAMLYFDYTGSDPVITIYAYNGSSIFTSHAKGTANNSDAPDRIASSLNDDSFVLDLTANKSASALTFDVTLDVSGVNSHTPLYWNAAGWKGMQFDDLFGLWFHTITNGTSNYWGGYVENLSWGSRGWLDVGNRATVANEVCTPI